jgi:RimJ/RimL family protein N-acetyltransferase
MNKIFSLESPEFPSVVLRTISAVDQENLRNWKNAVKDSFFFKQIIEPPDQHRWFEGYLSRSEDYMFIVETGSHKVGCMGIRHLETEWDIYNVILGDKANSQKGVMGHAIRLMCSYALSLSDKPIRAKVLSDNPALKWYRNNSFQVIATNTDHVIIDLDRSCFQTCLYSSLLE